MSSPQTVRPQPRKTPPSRANFAQERRNTAHKNALSGANDRWYGSCFSKSGRRRTFEDERAAWWKEKGYRMRTFSGKECALLAGVAALYGFLLMAIPVSILWPDADPSRGRQPPTEWARDLIDARYRSRNSGKTTLIRGSLSACIS